MDDRRRLGLTLFMSSPLQRRAWELVSAIPAGQRTEAICMAVCRDQDRSEMLDALRTVLQEGGASELKSEEPEKEMRESGGIDDNVLTFLRSLQGDGGDDT